MCDVLQDLFVTGDWADNNAETLLKEDGIWSEENMILPFSCHAMLLSNMNKYFFSDEMFGEFEDLENPKMGGCGGERENEEEDHDGTDEDGKEEPQRKKYT